LVNFMVICDLGPDTSLHDNGTCGGCIVNANVRFLNQNFA